MKFYIYLIMTVSMFILAMCLSLFLPTRIAVHGDGENTSYTHKLYASLFSYFVLSRPIGDNARRIGVTPYTEYYVRTYAGEIWLLVALFLALTAKSYRDKNTILNKIMS